MIHQIRSLHRAAIAAAVLILPVVVLQPAPAQAFPATSRTTMVNYLAGISGRSTIAGQHNREPNSDPTKYTRVAQQITGQTPGLWGGDFLFSPDDVNHRQTMISEAIRQWQAGSVVTLTWHMCPPTVGSTCGWDSGGILSHLSDSQWNQLVTTGSSLNNAWKRRLDEAVPYLQQLKNAGVPALFRPLHEMNQGWSWWGGRPGVNGSRKLYQITRDYLVATKGLTNLVWVWNLKDLSGGEGQTGNYWPGAAYVDLASLDVWVAKQPTTSWYQAMLGIAGGKPIALGEVGQVPSVSLLQAQPRWTYFMVWAEYLTDPNYNNNAAVQNTYWNSRVLVRGEFGIGG